MKSNFIAIALEKTKIYACPCSGASTSPFITSLITPITNIMCARLMCACAVVHMWLLSRMRELYVH